MTTVADLQSELEQIDQSLDDLKKQLLTIAELQQKLKSRKSSIERELKQRQNFFLESTSEPVWQFEDFPWSSEVRMKLIEVFKMKRFRPKQIETINATLSNRDVILIMSTGGGKSLCYQLPALISKGITLVVSPLISLMNDQVLGLKKFGIQAAAMNSESSKETIYSVKRAMEEGNGTIKLVYVTPEKISKSKRFKAQLEKCYKCGNLSRIVIDEVHCASQWGNDFRPDYKILSILKRQFPNTPILGLTATSTEKVTVDTKDILNIPFAIVFRTPLNRPNLFYDVRIKPSSHKDLIEDILNLILNCFEKKPGIIYCFSRKDTEEVSKSLSEYGIKSAPYHAYLTTESKTQVHNAWIENKLQVICATVAFGMGIDKPDVRFVIHHSLSKSVENYYQESGRAGRDGLPALCLLYFGFTDIFRQSSMVLTERTGLDNLQRMVEYSQDLSGCRRNLIASYFQETWESLSCNEMCDVCAGITTAKIRDVTVPCRALLHTVQSAEAKGEGNRLTGLKLVDCAAGRGKSKTDCEALKNMGTEQVQRLIVHMLSKEYLREDFHFTPYRTISYITPGPQSELLAETTVQLLMPTTRIKQNDDIYKRALSPSKFIETETPGTSTNSFKRPTRVARPVKTEHDEIIIKRRKFSEDPAASVDENNLDLSLEIKEEPILIDDSD
uniref:ATP-dependent DNA helicase n=1 Tax=Phallusia mammillata TaxID=59560 RepID=A0A6F9DPY7_9ASCI|nr:ATP-dependent DNA helicase Q1 [Phallusia mammillata]